MVTVQAEDRWNGGLADKTEHIDPEIVEHQTRPAHGTDEVALPAGGRTGHYQSVGSRQDGAGKYADTEIEALILLGQMNAEVHRTEIAVETIFFDLVETARRIDQEYSLEHIHKFPQSFCRPCPAV